jgi:hypothetical protein
MPFKELLADAPKSYFRGHLGEEFCSLLDLLEEGRAEDHRLRAVAPIANDVKHLPAHKAGRSALIATVPSPKQTELAQRLDLANDEQKPLEYLQSLTGMAGELRELLGASASPLTTHVPNQHHQGTSPESVMFPINFVPHAKSESCCMRPSRSRASLTNRGAPHHPTLPEPCL